MGIIHLIRKSKDGKAVRGIMRFGTQEVATLEYMNNIIDVPTDKTWVDYFWPHFLVVSSVVYIIILCTVLIGTAIPAVKIIGSKITNALRDE